jgi:oligopeptide/dipeptide ABC transporter ATP-binding protein
MNEPLLQVTDAHVRFGSARAVDGVSLEVYSGEVLAIVGESGSGKTTLVRAIQGLQSLAEGTIAFPKSRVDSADGKRAARRGVQMIFQDPTGALNPRHTIYDIVAEGFRIRRDRADERERVATALNRSGLRPAERFMQLYPHELSGGQRQRVVIAGAMAMEPELLLADEPVASLDASVRGEILALMRSLVDDHDLTIIAVTHDLGLAWNIADRIAVMYLGRIVEIGDTEQVLSDPQHPYTQALLSVVPEVRSMDQQVLTGEPPDPRHIPAGCRFHPRCPVVASGAAEARGFVGRCTGTDVALAGTSHRVACHDPNLV